MSIIEIAAMDDPRVAGYRDMKERDLRARQGLFVVEGRVNLRCLIERSSYRPRSVLLSPAAHAALQNVLGELDKSVPIYLAPHDVLKEVVGYKLHRGCLALCERPEEPSVASVLELAPPPPASSLVIVLEGLANHDNVGGIFRNAMAFGADAVLLCPRCCDPLYRKAIRTSIGGTFCVPFTRDATWPDEVFAALGRASYTLVALDPRGERLAPGGAELPARTALILGSEGAGLSESVRAAADLRLRIDMAFEVDSLNVATAAGIAMHHFFEAHPAAGRLRVAAGRAPS